MDRSWPPAAAMARYTVGSLELFTPFIHLACVRHGLPSFASLEDKKGEASRCVYAGKARTSRVDQTATLHTVGALLTVRIRNIKSLHMSFSPEWHQPTPQGRPDLLLVERGVIYRRLQNGALRHSGFSDRYQTSGLCHPTKSAWQGM